MVTEVAALLTAKICQHVGGIIKMHHINETEITALLKSPVICPCNNTEVVIQ